MLSIRRQTVAMMIINW